MWYTEWTKPLHQASNKRLLRRFSPTKVIFHLLLVLIPLSHSKVFIDNSNKKLKQNQVCEEKPSHDKHTSDYALLVLLGRTDHIEH